MRHVPVPLVCLSLVAACGPSANDLESEVVEVRVDHPEVSSASNDVRPRLCAAGSVRHVLWQDLREGTSAVWYNRSEDGGATFLEADVRLDDGAGVATDPRVACDQDRVYATWLDSGRDAGGRDGVRLVASSDGGATFGDGVWLDADGDDAYSAMSPEIAAAGATVVVAWADARNGAYDIFVNVSPDSGASWFVEPVRVDGGEAGEAWSAEPKIAMSETGRVVVVWQDGRNDVADIYAATSAVYGQSFDDAVRLDEGLPGGGESFAPVLELNGDRLAVAWHDGGVETGWSVAVAESTDGGESWSDATTVSEEGTDAFEPAMAWDEDTLHLAWHARFDDAYDIVAAFESAGSWSEPQQLNTDDGGVFDAYEVRLLADGGEVIAAWHDRRYDTSDVGMNDLYFSRSIDAGATWLSEDVRLNGGEAGTSYASGCQIAREGSSLFAVWEDGRFGFSGVLATTRVLDEEAAE